MYLSFYAAIKRSYHANATIVPLPAFSIHIASQKSKLFQKETNNCSSQKEAAEKLQLRKIAISLSTYDAPAPICPGPCCAFLRLVRHSHFLQNIVLHLLQEERLMNFFDVMFESKLENSTSPPSIILGCWIDDADGGGSVKETISVSHLRMSRILFPFCYAFGLKDSSIKGKRGGEA